MRVTVLYQKATANYVPACFRIFCHLIQIEIMIHEEIGVTPFVQIGRASCRERV